MPDDDFITLNLSSEQAEALGYLILVCIRNGLIPDAFQPHILSFSETVSMEIVRQKNDLFQ